MNRFVTRILIAGTAAVFAIAPAAAQNLPPPGNINPGSLNSGAEETGAENQPRSFGPYDSYYGTAAPYYAPAYDSYAAETYDSYAAPRGVMTRGPFDYAPGYGPYGPGTGGAGALGANN